MKCLLVSTAMVFNGTLVAYNIGHVGVLSFHDPTGGLKSKLENKLAIKKSKKIRVFYLTTVDFI